MYPRALILFAFLNLGLLQAEETPTARRILYLAHQGNTAEAIDLYRTYVKDRQQADYEVLQQLGLDLLETGFTSAEPESQLLAVYGAGIAAHDQAITLLAKGLNSPVPEIQLVSLDLLSKLGNDDADMMINRAASSDLLLIRLTAINFLAQKKHPLAIGQIEALYHKILPELRPLFPQFFALTGDPRAIRQLRRLLHDEVEEVRVETILSIGEHGRDDLLPQVRSRLNQPHPVEQEACAAVVGKLADQSAIPRLRRLVQSKVAAVRLAACQALYRLGEHDVKPTVETLAKDGDLFAIALLGEIDGSEECLSQLVRNPNIQIRCNATLALLKRGSVRCIDGLAELLIRDCRDLAFVESQNRGRSLSIWRPTSAANHLLRDTPVLLELSTALREQVMRDCSTLPQEIFLGVANLILERQQNDLVPVTVELLEENGSHAAVRLLKQHQQKLGAPLVRNYCTLAFYRIGEPGSYGQALRQWLLEQRQVEMISFRPYVPLELRDHDLTYTLTPKETSRLFIASIEAIGNQHDQDGIDVILDLIHTGNPKNRYALAGLLVRTTQ